MARAIHWNIPFVSLDGTPYDINIYEDNYSGSVVVLKGATNPIETDEADDDDPFIPIRKQSGYIRFMDETGLQGMEISPVYAFDRYLELVSNGVVVWQGYIMTDEYSGSYTAPPYEVELPIKSAASMMDNGQFVATEDYVRFGALIKKCLDSCNVTWQNVYLPLIENEYSANAIKELLYAVYDGNFITDDDTEQECGGINPTLASPADGQTYTDILSEVCLFLGWQLREVGKDLYFVAADITNEYSKIAYNDLESLSPTVEKVTFSNEEIPTYDEAEHTIDILQGKSQIRITADTNPLKGDVLGLSIENGDFVRTTGSTYNNGKYGYLAYCFQNTDRVWTRQTEPGFPAYNMSGSFIYTGACWAKDKFYEIDNQPTGIDGCEEAITICGMKGILSTDEEITIRSKRKIAFVQTSGTTTLRLSANVSACKHFYGDDFKYNPHCYVNAYLKIGDKYYNGSGWVDSKTPWKLRLGLPGTWDKSNAEDKEDGVGCIFTDAAPKLKYADVEIPSGMVGRVEFSLCLPNSAAADYQYIRISGLQFTVQSRFVSYYKNRYNIDARKYNVQLDSGYTDVYESKRKLCGGEYSSLATVFGTQIIGTAIDFYRAVDFSQAYLDRFSKWYNRTIRKITAKVKKTNLSPADRYLFNNYIYLLGSVNTNWRDDSQQIMLYQTVTNTSKELELLTIYSNDVDRYADGKYVIRKSGTYHFLVAYTPADTTDTDVTWTFEGLSSNNGRQIDNDGTLLVFNMPAGTYGFTVKVTSTEHPEISRSVNVLFIP